MLRGTFHIEIIARGNPPKIKPPCRASTEVGYAPTGIRTLVLALKGLRPGPLDDGGVRYRPAHIVTIIDGFGKGIDSWTKNYFPNRDGRVIIPRRAAPGVINSPEKVRYMEDDG